MSCSNQLQDEVRLTVDYTTELRTECPEIGP